MFYCNLVYSLAVSMARQNSLLGRCDFSLFMVHSTSSLMARWIGCEGEMLIFYCPLSKQSPGYGGLFARERINFFWSTLWQSPMLDRLAVWG